MGCSRIQRAWGSNGVAPLWHDLWVFSEMDYAAKHLCMPLFENAAAIKPCSTFSTALQLRASFACQA